MRDSIQLDLFRPVVIPPRDLLQSPQEDLAAMARKRAQKKGYLIRRGPSWLLRWREYVRMPDGSLKPERKGRVIAPAIGDGALSKREAQRLAGEEILAPLDKKELRPGSLATVEEFIERKFIPEWVWSLKSAGKSHYHYLLKNHVVPGLGKMRLKDVELQHVQMLAKEKFESGLSWQTVKHIVNAVSGVFHHAKVSQCYVGENPAKDVRLPEKRVRAAQSVSFAHIRMLIQQLSSPSREMAALAVGTSMNVAEMCGLRWRWVNLTDGVVQVDQDILAPFSLAVRANYYEREYTTVKSGHRYRILGLTPELAGMLIEIKTSSKFQGDMDPVFASRNGTPVDSHNLYNRHLHPAGLKLGLNIGWHDFRRAHSTFASQLSIPMSDREKMMGHSNSAQTREYEVEDVERRRQGTIAIMRGVSEAKDLPKVEPRTESKVVEISSKKRRSA